MPTTIVSAQAPDLPRGGAVGLSGGSPEEHNFVPDFAWAVVGGIAVVAVCAVVYTLAVTWGGLHVGTPLPGGGSAPLSTVSSELTGIFLAGFLLVLIARSLTARSH